MTNSEQTSVLITGGNKGLGFEAARRLAEQGWMIFLGSRDEDRGRAAADRLTVTEGTDPIIQLAMIDADGPTGTFTDRLGPVPW
jgi:NAD(P)-dependent dehydrogenase (short-subunit alcohol dehydrogenase family)